MKQKEMIKKGKYMDNDNKTYYENDRSDYHMLGADMNQHKDSPIFITVGLRTRVPLLWIADKYLYTYQCWMRPSDGERDTETLRTSTQSAIDHRTTNRN